MLFRIILLGLVATLTSTVVLAQALPPKVDALLARAKIPRDAVAMLVVDATGKAAPRLSHRPDVALNPASVMKLVTTYAALDLLGPAYTWRTPVWVDGFVRDGTLFGNLYIKGQGDPKLVVERLWLLMRQVRGLGIDTIAGDIVLDHSAFEPSESDPGSFAAIQRLTRRPLAQFQVGGYDVRARPGHQHGPGLFRATTGWRAAANTRAVGPWGMRRLPRSIKSRFF